MSMTHLPLCDGGICRTQGPQRVNSLLKATQPLYHRGKTRSEKEEEEEEVEEEEGEGEDDEEEERRTLFSVYILFHKSTLALHSPSVWSHTCIWKSYYIHAGIHRSMQDFQIKLNDIFNILIFYYHICMIQIITFPCTVH